MGLSLNIAFKKNVSPFGKLGADHPAVGNALQRLDNLAKKHKVAALSNFHSVDPEEAAEMLDMDPEELGLKPLEWFDPKHGLEAVQALSQLLRDHPKAIAKSAEILKELETIAQELSQAQKQKAKFHFALLD